MYLTVLFLLVFYYFKSRHLGNMSPSPSQIIKYKQNLVLTYPNPRGMREGPFCLSQIDVLYVISFPIFKIVWHLFQLLLTAFLNPIHNFEHFFFTWHMIFKGDIGVGKNWTSCCKKNCYCVNIVWFYSSGLVFSMWSGKQTSR